MCGKIGGRSRNRTYDPLIKSQLLYHLSYAPWERGRFIPREGPGYKSGSVPPDRDHRPPNGSGRGTGGQRSMVSNVGGIAPAAEQDVAVNVDAHQKTEREQQG